MELCCRRLHGVGTDTGCTLYRAINQEPAGNDLGALVQDIDVLIVLELPGR